MQIYKNRPYVICHILSAIDGRISGSFFGMPEIAEVAPIYGKIRQNYNCDAVLNGTITCSEIYADGFFTDLPKTDKKFNREDYIAKTDLKKYVVCIDTAGKLKWNKNYIDRTGMPKSHIIEVLTENVSDDYLQHLCEKDISYIFAGQSKLKIPILMSKLNKIFNIEKLMICGGGAVNWSFLQAGMIDELSLVIAPLADAKRDTATLFDRSDFMPEGLPVAFSLMSVEKISDNGIWLKYLSKNRK